MMSSNNDSTVKCKSFVSEAELEVIRLKRQEEWEKVRKPEDPLEAPEEEYDPRSLFDRLQEEKDRRQLELDESRRLKNLIKGLDDDEVAFLELVDQTKVEMETKLWQEEKKELQEFRQAVSNLSDDEAEARLRQMRRSLNINNTGCGKKSQHTLLAGALKRKASSSAGSPEKKKCPLTVESQNSIEVKDSPANGKVNSEEETAAPSTLQRNVSDCKTITCLGILPGLGAYSDSSDSENSSESDIDNTHEFDLLGRKRLALAQIKELVKESQKAQ